jgi:hypothetical protein
MPLAAGSVQRDLASAFDSHQQGETLKRHETRVGHSHLQNCIKTLESEVVKLNSRQDTTIPIDDSELALSKLGR